MASPISLANGLVILLFILNTTLCSTHTFASQKLDINLIHRDSKLSPYYDPNATIWELRKRAIDQSFARINYYPKRLAEGRRNGIVSPNIDDDIEFGLFPDYNGSMFLANISVGNPPTPQILIIDTSSHLSWVRCDPCLNCAGSQTVPIFDPTKSSTYSKIPCLPDQTECRASSGVCDSQNNCIFNFTYYDDSKVTGDVASEQVVFGVGKTPVQLKAFGCAHQVSALSTNEASGVLGIGNESYSVINQVGSKFSICLGSITDPNYPYNRLKIGEGTDLEGPSVPINVSQNIYFVPLQGISVGDEFLDVDPSLFRMTPQGDGGVVLDMGTTLTFLTKTAYDVLHDKVEDLMESNGLEAAYHDPQLLCYNGKVDEDVPWFPPVTFNFGEGGADLVLDPYRLFWQVKSDAFCMAVAASPNDKLSVIGIISIQDYNIGIDIHNQRLYVQSIDCQLLDQS